MTEFELFRLMRLELLAGLAEQGVTAEHVDVAQAYQPGTEGLSQNTVYFFSTSTPALGWQGRKYRVDLDRNEYVRGETQAHALNLQVFVLWDDGRLNRAASDILTMVRQIVASSRFTGALARARVFMDRPTDIRNPFFYNDRNQAQASPSFDFALTFARTIEQVSPAVDRVEFDMNRI